MEQKYEKIEFGKLSEAIAYLENGGYLCQLDGGHAYEIDDYQALTIHWREPLFTKAKLAPWHERLNGERGNGVLCWISDDGDHFSCVDVVIGIADSRYITRGTCGKDVSWAYATPLTRAEIQRFMDNAPD